MKNVLKIKNDSSKYSWITVNKANTEKFIKEINEIGKSVGVKVIAQYKVGNIPFCELPFEVQMDVLDTLKAYDTVNVHYEYGEWHVLAGSFLKASYNFDFFVGGTYNAKDLYTPWERRQNFRECFGYYERCYR